MDEPLDLNKKRVIPEIMYSVVENLGWDAKDKKQKKIGEITQLQFIDLQSEVKLKLVNEEDDSDYYIGPDGHYEKDDE
jgi:hypothetical protein